MYAHSAVLERLRDDTYSSQRDAYCVRQHLGLAIRRPGDRWTDYRRSASLASVLAALRARGLWRIVAPLLTCSGQAIPPRVAPRRSRPSENSQRLSTTLTGKK